MAPLSPRRSSAAEWPTGHAAWAFAGIVQLEGRAASFLAAGIQRGERVMYVADDPKAAHWPSPHQESGALVIASTNDIYGSERIVAAAAQRATFEDALADARRDGFVGLRVIADNTSLVDGPDRLARWLEWESVADDFMAANPVTGMCAFDRTRLTSAELAALLTMHRTLVDPDDEHLHA